MLGHPEVQNTAASMSDDEKAIQHAERKGWNREKVHRSNGLAVIVEKCLPALCWFWIFRGSLHPARNGSLRELESQLQQFPLNARRSPGGIFHHHLEDQIADLVGNPLPATDPLSHSAEQGPVQPESGLVPASNRLRHEQKERLLPGGPESAGRHPEELIEQVESWLGVLAFQNRELLAKNEILQQETSVGMKKAKDYSKQQPEEVEHGGQVIADGILAYLRKLLISKPDGIVANDGRKKKAQD